MSYHTEVHVLGLKSAQLSLSMRELSRVGTLDHQPGKITVQWSDVKLELTGDAYEQFMRKAMPLDLRQPVGEELEAQLSIQLLLPAESALNFSSILESHALSTITPTATRRGSTSSQKPE